MEGSEGSGLGARKGVEGMDVAADDWAEEMANQSKGERPSTPNAPPRAGEQPQPQS